MKTTVTLDATCFFDYFERDDANVKKIIELSEKGIIDIAKTTRIMNDTLLKTNRNDKKSEIWEQIQTLPVKTIGTVVRWNHSVWNGGDVWGGDEHIEMKNKIKTIAPSMGLEDVDHLIGHIINKRDVFITSDRHFLDNKDRLKENINVEIMSPKDFVRKTEEEIKIIEKY